MIVKTAEIKLQIPWAQSLKDKRMVLKSLITKTRDKFNVSISEVDQQDTIQTAVIGIAVVGNDNQQTESAMEHILCFMENRSDGEITDILRETR